VQFPFVRPAWQEQPIYKINVTPQFCQTEQSHCYTLKLLAETYCMYDGPAKQVSAGIACGDLSQNVVSGLHMVCHFCLDMHLQ